MWLSGGYDHEPMWLQGGEGYAGEVAGFIPGQNAEPAAVVRLDSPLRLNESQGQYLVLELRHEDARWLSTGIVHVELCSFLPESVRWQDREKGVWVEGAASYSKETGT